MEIIFWNGSFVSKDKVLIPFNERGFLYGDGVYTTLKVNNGFVRFLNSHLIRLQSHSEKVNIIFPEFRMDWINELIKQNNASTGFWRLKIIITGGERDSLDLPQRTHGHLLITLKPFIPLSNPCVRLTVFPEPIVKPTAQIKSLASLDRLVIKEYAKQKHYDDAIVLNSENFILETSYSNFFFKSGNYLYTPDPLLPILEGITIGKIAEISAKLGYSMLKSRFKLEDIPQSAQIYTCNSLNELSPVIAIDDKAFGRDLFFERPLRDNLLSSS
jgi:4-amino-4-deoxychorismate lyase